MKNIQILVLVMVAVGAVMAPMAALADTNADLLGIASILESLQAAVLAIANQIEHLVSRPANTSVDITNDGMVGENDWIFMKSKWFSADTTADINGDGIVNSIDFGLLNRSWNTTVR